MNAAGERPPRIASWLLSRILPKKDAVFLCGEFEEIFFEILEKKGVASAQAWYWMQVLKSAPGFIMYSLYWRVAMLRNYLVISLRNLRKNTLYSLINVSGLATGLAGFAIFAFIAGINFNADKFHKNAERMYGVIQDIKAPNGDRIHTAYTPIPLLPALRNECSEIEDAVRVMHAGRMTVRRNSDSFFEDKVLFVDPNFLSFFTFRMIAGDPETVLAEPYSAVLTESAAFKYFGDDNPVGKSLILDNNVDVTVTGIVEDKPPTSSIVFEFLIPIKAAEALLTGLDNWHDNRTASFVLLTDSSTPNILERKLPAFIDQYMGDAPGFPEQIYLFPLLDFRLNSNHIRTFMINTMKGDQYGFLAVGIVLLIVVGINFMNLSTARYMSRTKEIGLRKVIGARRSQLVRQFLGESLLLSFIALPLGIILFFLLMNFVGPYISEGEKYSRSFQYYAFLLKYLVEASLLMGICAGIYPAFFLSSFKPVNILRGGFQSARKGGRGRKILVVSQFALSVILIIISVTLKKQFDYLLHVDLGFNRDDVAVIRMTGLDHNAVRLLQEELSKSPQVESVSSSAGLPVRWQADRDVIPEDRSSDEALVFDVYGAGYGFTEVLDIPLVLGRRFSMDFGLAGGFIINETAVQRLDWDDPVGKQLSIEDKTETVIGVVKDFQFRYIGYNIQPAVLYVESDKPDYMLIEVVSPDGIHAVRSFIADFWPGFSPDLPFEFFTLDDHYYDQYRYIEILSVLGSMIGIVAVIYSCLGLLGLAAYTVERRTKEIGIRKALGASIAGVIWIFLKEFLILVTISNLIAIPLAYITVDGLLQLAWRFYRTDIGVIVFLFAAFITLFTAVITVTLQTLRAAQSNPVDSLRYE